MQLNAHYFWWNVKSNHLLNYTHLILNHYGVFVVAFTLLQKCWEFIDIQCISNNIVFDYRLPSHFIKYFRWLKSIPTEDHCKLIWKSHRYVSVSLKQPQQMRQRNHRFSVSRNFTCFQIPIDNLQALFAHCTNGCAPYQPI